MKLSQESFAEKAGISVNTVSRIEGGQTAMSVEIFRKMIEILETDANVLLGKEGGGIEKQESVQEVLYHIQQCEYNNFFTKTNHFAQSLNGRIYDLTPKAHEFLANIRSDNLWRKTKSAASKIGSVALPVLQQIASNVVEGAVKSYFGLS